MAGIKLKTDFANYLGIPYFTNKGKYKNHGENVLVGKGTAKEIALKTIELANEKNIKLIELSSQQIYNFQKKNHLGIDCSGLVCHLLNRGLDVRKTSANMLTSSPLAKEISVSKAKEGDLIRQKNGQHVLYILEKDGDIIHYIDSSREGRGVRLGQLDATSLQSVHRIQADR
jgi:hypothetical protein